MFANDRIFDALAHIERRRLLINLFHHDPQALPELSAETEDLLEAHDALIGQFLSSSRAGTNVDKALLRLYHVHLPMLARFGFIRWRRGAGVVSKGPHFDDLRPLLELLADQQEAPPATGTGVPLRS